MSTEKQKIALVFGNLPTVEEIDQFQLLAEDYQINVISSESICGFLSQNSRFQDLQCIALPDHDENPTYLPGLEQALSNFDIVVIKERLGLYAYQAVKAKWKNRFRLAVWVDNLTPIPGEDISQMRTIRTEVNNSADVFVVQTDAAKTSLLIEGIEEERIRTMIPTAKERVKKSKKNRAHALAALKLPESSFVIAHFGQVEWEEGLLDLAHAVKMIKRKGGTFGDRIQLVFCGIGSFGTQLRDSMVALGIDDCATYVAPNRNAADAVMEAADCLYFSSIPARDRVEGDPYRLLVAMANETPVLAPRTPLVEEICGKHRFDFCNGSISSLVDAIEKAADANALRNNIVKKNVSTIKRTYSEAKAKKSMEAICRDLFQSAPVVDASALDHKVLEVESKVSAKQYLAAIDLIESIFQVEGLAIHHKANLYRLIGDCFAKLGDNDAAKDAYIKAIDLDPYSAKAYIGLGTVGLVRGSHDIAVIHFQKAVSLAPEDEMANLGLGLAFQGLDEPEEASRWVMKALDVNVENTPALYTLVKIANEIDKYDDAAKAVSRYVGMHPNDHNMIYTLGGIQYKQGNYSEVVELMQQIIATDPLDSRAHTLQKQAKRAMEQSAPAGSSNA